MIVLEDGRMAEQGTWDTLATAGGTFSSVDPQPRSVDTIRRLPDGLASGHLADFRAFLSTQFANLRYRARVDRAEITRIAAHARFAWD